MTRDEKILAAVREVEGASRLLDVANARAAAADKELIDADQARVLALDAFKAKRFSLDAIIRESASVVSRTDYEGGPRLVGREFI